MVVPHAAGDQTLKSISILWRLYLHHSSPGGLPSSALHRLALITGALQPWSDSLRHMSISRFFQ